MTATDTWDVVVAGAGHNSLVCAAYLARAGLRVLVLERNARIGGDTSTEELTVPGFQHDACASAHVLIQSSPMIRDRELNVSREGGPMRWDALKNDVSEALLERYLGFTTNLTRRNILGRHVESPLDLERRNPHNYRGSCHGGDQNLAQEGALRMVPGRGGYRLPVAGLYQTGSTTHPGASVTGAPGCNCASAVLDDLGSSLQAAIGRTAAVSA